MAEKEKKLDLLSFIIPLKHRPGTDLMSKTILKDKKVINLIVSVLVGNHAINNYISQDGEWLDGKRADVLLVPAINVSESMPPVLIEIQNTLDNAYIHRLNKYCNYVYDKYNNFEPIAFTICIKNIREEICSMFSDTHKASYLKKLPSRFWAKEHLIMTPATIANYIHSNENDEDDSDSDGDSDGNTNSTNNSVNVNDNVNNSNTSNSNTSNTSTSNTNTTSTNSHFLPPLVALGYVLMEQKCSLFGLQYKEDPTVILLYKIAKEALEHQIQNHEATVDTLLEVATETQKQFKRIIEAANEGEPSLKKIRSLARAGVLYTEACLHKYQQQSCDDSDVMTTIVPQKDDIQYAREFKEEYLKNHKRMNWKACYDKGLNEGYFSTYKSHITLKSTFNEVNK
ncbi:hypothetical protein BD770DRAFT_377499 [Pilaira anomala]|nr:hypothetical protein BD770DRAFT_377499 [Pilaira anomala]